MVQNIPRTRFRGSTTSLWPRRVKLAFRPSTKTFRTRIPTKSREYDDNGCFARARIVVRARRWLVAG